MEMASHRVRVMTLYRTLLHLGKEYPQVHLAYLRYSFCLTCLLCRVTHISGIAVMEHS